MSKKRSLAQSGAYFFMGLSSFIILLPLGKNKQQGCLSIFMEKVHFSLCHQIKMNFSIG